MNPLEGIHERYGAPRRVRILADRIAPLLPRSASLLDVGCGDGEIDRWILDRRADARIRGIDVLVRPDAKIEVTPFDGHEIPFPDDAFDGVMFVDVLHHSDDATALLREAHRVARRFVIIKDHRLNGFMAERTLRFMDDAGNERFGVSLPYNYWPHERWHATFLELGLSIASWEQHLGIYPWPATWLFDRGLHFVAKLDIRPGESNPPPRREE